MPGESLTNYAKNSVTTTLSINGASAGKRTDKFESETSWGDIPGLWHSVTFDGVAVAEGDTLALSMAVDSGDYKNSVSRVEVYGE